MDAEEHDVRPELPNRLLRVASVLNLAHDLDVVVRQQRRPQASGVAGFVARFLARFVARYYNANPG